MSLCVYQNPYSSKSEPWALVTDNYQHWLIHCNAYTTLTQGADNRGTLAEGRKAEGGTGTLNFLLNVSVNLKVLKNTTPVCFSQESRFGLHPDAPRTSPATQRAQSASGDWLQSSWLKGSDPRISQVTFHPLFKSVSRVRAHVPHKSESPDGHNQARQKKEG